MTKAIRLMQENIKLGRFGSDGTDGSELGRFIGDDAIRGELAGCGHDDEEGD